MCVARHHQGPSNWAPACAGEGKGPPCPPANIFAPSREPLKNLPASPHRQRPSLGSTPPRQRDQLEPGKRIRRVNRRWHTVQDRVGDPLIIKPPVTPRR